MSFEKKKFLIIGSSGGVGSAVKKIFLNNCEFETLDRDVWDIAAFKGATHVSKDEREAFSNLLDWGLVDSFRNQYPEDDGVYTFWDYRQGSFYKKLGMRIDFILSTISMDKTLDVIVVDRNARKGEKPSDHAPVVADYSLG